MGVIRTENAKVLWRTESDWGAGGSGSWYRFGHHEIINAPDPEYDWYPFFGVFSGRNRDTIFRGRQSFRGSCPDIRMQGGREQFLAHLFGRASGSYYLEGRTAIDQTLPSFEMAIDMVDTDGVTQLARRYRGGMVNRWTLSANEGEELRMGLDEMLFRDMQTNVSGTAKYEAGVGGTDPGASREGRYTFAECQFNMLGLTFSHIRRFSLSCDQQIEMRYYLQRGGGSDYQQIPNAFVPGKRAYRLEIDLDMADPAIDRDVWEFLLNQGAASWPGYTLGTQITMDFQQTGSGEGVGHLVLTCSSSGYSVEHPGSVVASAPVNIPAPPAGLPTCTVAFDVSDARAWVA